MQLDELVHYLDTTLQLGAFAGDPSNNGLQIEGRSEIRKVVAGVDACQALFDRAVAANADLVLAHHGLSWGGEPRRFVGITAKRLATMFGHGISLYAAHLPLDAHVELGNNAELARLAGAQYPTPACDYHGMRIGIVGSLPQAPAVTELAALYESLLHTRAAVFAPEAPRCCKRALFVSGGGGNEALSAALAEKADVLVTGEFQHQMYHEAREMGMAVIALGHYASETLGVKAVLRRLEAAFGLETEFINLPTGL